MKKLIIATGLLIAAGSAVAGGQGYGAVSADVGSDSSAVGALMLLALVGLVIVAGKMGTAEKSEPDPLLIPAESDEEGS